MMNDEVYERITLAYLWLVEPNCTENIHVRWSLREKIITIYLIMNRNVYLYKLQSKKPVTYVSSCDVT